MSDELRECNFCGRQTRQNRNACRKCGRGVLIRASMAEAANRYFSPAFPGKREVFTRA